jgi:hypothetical protein
MKKAQIQNMETITVVIIIVMMIIFGLIYASSQRQDSIQRDRERISDTEAMLITKNTLNLDVVKCSQSEASLETCIDYHKIKALSENAKKEENIFYFNRLFGNSDIRIIILKNLTQNQENENITIHNTTQNEEYVNKVQIRTPVTVKEPVHNINYFSIIEVTAYR